jgi:hypothetical protein
MINMMEFADSRFELNLILVGKSITYINHLKKIAKKFPNINFLEPVPMIDLPQYLNQFDVGVYILEPNSFNNKYALPNKFFEFVQARLMIAIGPSPEMARIVTQYDLGVIADDFSPKSLATKLNQLDIDKINYYKQRSHEAAYELSADKNKEIFLDIVNRVLSQ